LLEAAVYLSTYLSAVSAANIAVMSVAAAALAVKTVWLTLLLPPARSGEHHDSGSHTHSQLAHSSTGLANVFLLFGFDHLPLAA
jgi:hypothetical protein